MERSDLESWFDLAHTQDTSGSCRHTWCVQTDTGRWRSCLPKLVRYFEHAHHDARTCFLASLGINLDPLGGDGPAYPNDLPHDTKRGYFGEALCGIIAEQLDVIGGDRWIVPAFLFRFHEEARLYLTRLVIGEGVGKSITGRTGSDFIALCVDANGNITKYLVAEAKCHKTFNATKCARALNKLGNEASTPVSLPQLAEILKDADTHVNAPIVASINDIFINKKLRSIQRVDLFLYGFDDPGVKRYDTVRVTPDLKEANYKANRPLHIFEVHIPDGSELVTELYNGMYQGVDRAAS